MMSSTLPVQMAATNVHLDIYPCMDGYIGKFALQECGDSTKSSSTSKATQTVVILDTSGSMGSEVERITNVLLPAMLRQLHYQDDDEIVFISFSCRGTCVVLTVAQLASHQITADGGTSMAKGLDMLVQHFSKLRSSEPLRLMIFSDGEVNDPEAVLKQSDNLARMFKVEGFSTNAQGFRWFTSSSQPDTKALASVLKLNTVGTVMLEDVDAQQSDDVLLETLVNVFKDDGLHESKKLHSKLTTKLFLDYPWQSFNASSMSVRPGDNVFWLTEVPRDGDISLQTCSGSNVSDADDLTIVPIKMCERLNSDNYLRVLSKKLNYFLDHLKLLKVNETTQAKEEITHIISYFTKLEKSMEAADDKVPDALAGVRSLGLANRLDILQKNITKRVGSLIYRMREIANDDKVSRLSAQQTADYLRKDLKIDKNMKGLASRIGDDLDFDSAARSEVRAMHAHLHELEDIDDSNHVTSFLDLETTLSGIRTTCELVNRQLPSGESLIDSADCSDVLRLLNIVGLACDAPVGTYPDAMTWRVNKLYLGTFCSVSDILTQGEADLVVPRGHQNEHSKIVNVIPFFEDVRIHRFLKKHAPRLLDLSAGEGMRRILGPVNGTFLYTICAGLLYLVGQLDKNRSTLYLSIFISLLETFSIQSGGYFDHILPYLHDQEIAEKTNLSYYIHNNGVTNMMYPVLQIIQSTPKYLKATKRDQSGQLDCTDKLLPRIYRSLYSYEVWQSVKRSFKNIENPIPVIKEALYEILGINVEKYKTNVTPLFEAEPTHIKHHDKYYINEEALNRHTQAFRYLDSITLIRPLFAAASKKDIEEMKNIPAVTDEFVLKSCDISYDMRHFRFYNIVQALIYSTKAARVDDGKAAAACDENNAESLVRADKCDAGVTVLSIGDITIETETETKREKEVSLETEGEEEVDYHSPRMRFADLKDQKAMEAFLSDYVMREYAARYQSDLGKKRVAEAAHLRSQLVQLFMDAESHEETVRLFKEGTSIGDRVCACSNFTSPVLKFLKDALFDMSRTCKRRLETIKLLLLGVDDEGEVVWNEGRALFSMDLSEYSAVFTAMGRTDLWKALSAEHRLRNKYDYNRDVRNRHDHGRDRPSYWAMGYATIGAMMLAVTNEEIPQSVFDEYCRVHVNCCGMNKR